MSVKESDFDFLQNGQYGIVRKSNDFILNYRYNLNAMELKLLLYIISQIKYEDSSFETVEIRLSSIFRIFGIGANGPNYRNLKDALKHLVTAPIFDADGNDFILLDPNDKASPRVLLKWIIEPTIDARKNTFYVTISPTMKKFLLDLRKNYTSYELQYILCFKNRYSIRLYELIKCVHYGDYDLDKQHYQWTISVKKLREVIGAEDVEQQYKFFKRRILMKAQEEINEFSDKDIRFEEIKAGRTVTDITFFIDTKSTEDRLEVYRRISERFRKKNKEEAEI